MHFEDPYQILGLTNEASEEEVKAAYEKLLEEDGKKEEAQAAYSQICEMKNQKTEEISEEKPQAEEKKKSTPGQMALGIAAIVVLAAVLAALILAAMGGKDQAEVPAETAAVTEATEAAAASTETAAPAETAATEAPTIPADGDPHNETAKGTYTGTDEEVKAAADTVVASMADYQLTNAQLQVYYWMGIQSMMQNNPYVSYMGLDVSKPLDSQPCPLAEGQSWQQFFLKQALISWQNYQSMAAEAELAGREMDEDLKQFLDTLPEEMEKQAQEAGFPDAAAMLANNVGAGADIEDYLHFMEVYNTGYGYFVDTLDAMEPKDEDLEAYFAEHEAELKEGGITKDSKVVSARHILIAPEDVANDEDWVKAEEKAKEILEQYLAGDKTSESFAKLATEHTMDPGSKQTGGLYEDFAKGQMVPEFDQWCFDANRKNGDTDIVKTEFGYHIMYYVSSRSVWQEQVTQIVMKENADKIIADGASKYPMDIDYGSILIGELKPYEAPAAE